MTSDVSPAEDAAENIISDPYLQNVLRGSKDTRDQCVALVNSISNRQLAPEDQTSLTQQQKLLYTRLSQLRGENRNGLVKVRETKQKTAEARQEVDRLHLQLQNLYYEERHLRGEIAACESYEYVTISPSLLFSSFYIVDPNTSSSKLTATRSP